MIKVVFFDVDGTLVSHNLKAVPESTLKAIEELRNKGIKCVVATGRHVEELKKLPVNVIDFDGYVSLNGQLCMDDKGEIILGNELKGEDKDKIIKMFNDKEIPVMLVEKDRLYVNMINDYVVMAQKAISTPLPDIDTYNGADFYQVVGFVTKEGELKLKQELSNSKITRWNEYGIDIISKVGGKGAGIKAYLEYYGINKEETMAFGDGENDIEMLEYAGIGIAMGNADEEVKSHADYITDSVDDDGIYKALRKFNMI